MNTKRALEIYHADEQIGVQLNGEPVWIEHVDEANGMATVQVGSRPTNTQTVSVDALTEGE
ncbi:H-type small acid-soluble spore protein [Paenibacillus daejeonensis]|uniref:H-type small acid-soluble spore protein n=1 Tax=Paenibacillus daejeonensis TaxID=135193 RepID=UPI00037154EF|nr:H-type small acid-soluble spore protein [Paenibacillus daejeonensis]